MKESNGTRYESLGCNETELPKGGSTDGCETETLVDRRELIEEHSNDDRRRYIDELYA